MISFEIVSKLIWTQSSSFQLHTVYRMNIPTHHFLSLRGIFHNRWTQWFGWPDWNSCYRLSGRLIILSHSWPLLNILVLHEDSRKAASDMTKSTGGDATKGGFNRIVTLTNFNFFHVLILSPLFTSLSCLLATGFFWKLCNSRFNNFISPSFTECVVIELSIDRGDGTLW